MKKASIYISLFFIVTLQQCQCEKEFGLDCATTKYNFELPVKAFSPKDTINIGDTIWFEINEPTTFKDKSTGAMINYSGAENIGTFLSTGRYNETLLSWVNEDPRNFNFIISNGNGKLLKQTDLGKEYAFSEKENKILFSLAVVPNKKGLFSIVFSNSGNTYRKNDKCTKANFEIIFQNTNQHYPLNPFYIPGSNPRGGDYYFVVK